METVRTSINTPLQIDSVIVTDSEGIIGMTMCPGKKEYYSHHRPWHRDLNMDLSVVKEWEWFGSTFLSKMDVHRDIYLKGVG